MGWDDIGYQSTDLKGITPNLDKLVAGGVKVGNLFEKWRRAQPPGATQITYMQNLYVQHCGGRDVYVARVAPTPLLLGFPSVRLEGLASLTPASRFERAHALDTPAVFHLGATTCTSH